MATKKITVNSGKGQLGYSHLYEPYVYKKNADDNKDDTQPEKPQYSAKIILDKKDNAEDIKRIKQAIRTIVSERTAEHKWSRQNKSVFALRDCDEAEITLDDGTIVTMAENDPGLRGKCILSARTKTRPDVRYVDSHGVFQHMPTPVLNPSEDQEERAARIEQFWGSKVFAGQNAVLTVKLSGWNSNVGQGVKATLEVVVIAGGGKPLGTVSFEDAFSAEEQAEIIAWARKNMLADVGSVEQDWEDSPIPDSEPDRVESGEDDDIEERPVEKKHKPRAKIVAEPVEEDGDEGVDIEEVEESMF